MYPRSIAWVLFFGGLAVMLLVDHYVRIESGVAPRGGLPEVVYYGVPILLCIASSCLLWRATKKYRRTLVRILEVVGHLAFGSVAYLFALLWYVTGTGIDSL